MNDHGLEQLIHFPTREENTLDLIITSIPGLFQDIHSPDKLSDHDIVAGSLKSFIPPKKKPRQKVYLYQKADYNSMRKDALNFANEKYFNGHYNSPPTSRGVKIPPGIFTPALDIFTPAGQDTVARVSSAPPRIFITNSYNSIENI